MHVGAHYSYARVYVRVCRYMLYVYILMYTRTHVAVIHPIHMTYRLTHPNEVDSPGCVVVPTYRIPMYPFPGLLPRVSLLLPMEGTFISTFSVIAVLHT